MLHYLRPVFLAAASAFLLAACGVTPPVSARSDLPASARPEEKIPDYQARFGRSRPVIAVVGDNTSTELSDYVIPFGVLARSGVADVLALATHPGTITTNSDLGSPSAKIVPQATIAEFDARYPEGADYVIVPATRADAALLKWLAEQGAKGGTMVSICNGALVLAKSGLLNGHRATAHWLTESERMELRPDVHWVKNARFVADGKVVSSAGVSAAIPTSVALVEAIAGHQRGAALAGELGIGYWGSRHDSDAFHPHFGVNLIALGSTVYTNGWLHGSDSLGIPAAQGVDEVALALTLDAYSSTGRSRAYIVADTAQPIHTLHGLVLLPDRVAGQPDLPRHMLPAVGAAAPARAFDQALAGIGDLYGRNTAYGVALIFEYPGYVN